MDGRKGGEDHGEQTIKGGERDWPMCSWKMNQKNSLRENWAFAYCWENCHMDCQLRA